MQKKMNHIAAAALAACLTVALAASAAPQGASAAKAGAAAVQVTLNEIPAELKHAPLLENGSVLLPLREVGALLGTRTTWMAEGKRIVVVLPTAHIEMKLGSREATVNGKPYRMPAAPKNVSGTVFVPVRFVSEALGANVAWTAKDRRVDLTVDSSYLFGEKGDSAYWVSRATGEVYVSKRNEPAKLVSGVRIVMKGYGGGLLIEPLVSGADLLTVTDSYGEPSLNDAIHRAIVADGACVLTSYVRYWGHHPIRTIDSTRNGNALLMDGSTLIEADAAGAVVARHDLAALTGYEDDAFQVEWYDDDVMVVRPHRTGWLTAIDRETNEAIRLADALLPEEQIAVYREMHTNDLEFGNWDGLRVVGREGDRLSLKHWWFLGNAEVNVTYVLQ